MEVLSAEDLHIESEQGLRSYLFQEAFEAGFTEIIFRNPLTGKEKILTPATLARWRVELPHSTAAGRPPTSSRRGT